MDKKTSQKVCASKAKGLFSFKELRLKVHVLILKKRKNYIPWCYYQETKITAEKIEFDLQPQHLV